MIQSIFLRNLQSHQKTKIHFDPGVNIIIGPSDSGKSAIIRGLKLVAYNRPSGNDIRSNWGGKTESKIYTDEGVVIRSKDKVEEYILHVDGGSIETEPIIFHAFKTEVPKEVSDFLNISDVNLQTQLDSPYLLSLTPGAVATHFNKVARLDKIDSATANINKWVRELNADVTHYEKDLQSKTEELQSFNYLQKYEIQLEVLEEMEKLQDRMIMASKQLDKLINSIGDVTEQIGVASEILPMGDSLDAIFVLKEEKRIKDIAFDILQRLIRAIEDVQRRMEHHQKRLDLEIPVNDLLTLFDNKNTLAIRFTALNKAVLTVNNTITLLKNKEANLALKSKAFTDNMGDVCILCNQPIKKGKHTHEN